MRWFRQHYCSFMHLQLAGQCTFYESMTNFPPRTIKWISFHFISFMSTTLDAKFHRLHCSAFWDCILQKRIHVNLLEFGSKNVAVNLLKINHHLSSYKKLICIWSSFCFNFLCLIFPQRTPVKHFRDEQITAPAPHKV